MPDAEQRHGTVQVEGRMFPFEMTSHDGVSLIARCQHQAIDVSGGGLTERDAIESLRERIREAITEG